MQRQEEAGVQMCSVALVKADLLPSCIQLAGCAASTNDSSGNVAIRLLLACSL
jgi:hypothetical protein